MNGARRGRTSELRASAVLTLYADDSGNTGHDLLNAAQPLGATAVVLLSPEQLAAMSACIDAARVQVRNRIPPGELKFNQLAKTASGRQMLALVLEGLAAVGATVFFSLVEKRYLAANLVVETFLDPLCTAAAPAEFIDPGERRKASNLVHHVLNDALTAEFLAAMASLDRGALDAVGQRIAGRLTLHPADEGPTLAAVLHRTSADPFDWSQIDDVRHARRPTPHSFAFAPLLSAVDQHLHKRGVTAVLVADVDAQFGPVLSRAFELARDPANFVGGVNFYGVSGPFERVRSLRHARSEVEPGIQLADLVAGLVATIARADVDGAPIDELAAPRHALRKALLRDAPSTYWQVSESALAKLTRSFGELVPPRDDWWWSRLWH